MFRWELYFNLTSFRLIRASSISSMVLLILAVVFFRLRLFKRWIALFTGYITVRRISIMEINCVIHWIEIYSVNSVIHFSNNWAQEVFDFICKCSEPQFRFLVLNTQFDRAFPPAVDDPLSHFAVLASH